MNELIFETEFFQVILNSEDQYYLGRGLVILKEEKGSLSDLTTEEWIDFSKVVKRYESALKQAFNATMFNWTCLMNNAYKQNPYNPHVHWHVRPRYDHKVIFEGVEWEDKEFGHHYARGIDKMSPEKTILKIIEEIKKYI